MYYKGLEKKMLAIFFVLLFIPLVIFVAISLYYTNEMGESIVKDSRETGAIVVSDAKVMGSLSINESKDALMNQTESYLQSLAIHKASENDLFFERIKKDSDSIAQYARGLFTGMNCRASECHASVTQVRINVLKENKSITDIKPTEESLDKAKSIAPILKLILDNNKHISHAYLGLKDGVFVLYSNTLNNTHPPSYDPRVQKWYISAVESKGTICTDMHVSVISKDYVITCATPVYSNSGDFIGVVGLDVSYESLSEHLFLIDSEKSGYVIIIDDKGKIIASSNSNIKDIKNDNLLQTNNTELKRIIENMVNRFTGYGKASIEGEEKYIAYAPINATKWSIGVVVPVSEIIKPTISTEKRIEKVTNETSHKIDESTKQISANIGKTTNKMQYMFSIIAIISIWVIVLSALYFGRKIKYYGMHLKDTKDFLDHIIENANDIIYAVDLKGNFNLLNKKIESISGYRREELIGKHFTEVLAPEYVEESVERFKRRIKGKAIPSDYELEIVTKEGKRVLLELTISAIRKSGKIVGVQGIARDITEKRKLEQKILEEKEYNENIIESSPIAIHVFDENLRVISANKAFYDYSGLKEEETIGKSIYELLPKQVLEKYEVDKRIIKVIESGETIYDSEVEFKSPRVGERILSVKYALVKETGEGAQNVMVMVEDVTEKAKLQKELEQAYKELKELDKMKSNFINVVAHELRTPLAVIKGFVGVLEINKEKNLTEKQKEHLKVINKNTDLLNKLISDMLDLSRVDSGIVELNYEEIDIPHLVKSVVKDFMPDLNKNKQTITLNIPDNLKISGDEQKITQIFSNLISNAIKYTPDNGKICINIEERNKDIIVQVRDTGIGILEKDLSKVFERFYMVDASLTRKVDRIGLGLSIVKSNVKLHGGNIWVESKLGKGSTFGFTLPKKRC